MSTFTPPEAGCCATPREGCSAGWRWQPLLSTTRAFSFSTSPQPGSIPVLRRKFWDHFGELKDQGRTLFVTTQYVGEAAYCDRVGVLVEGRLLTIDTPDGLRRQAVGGEAVDVRFDNPLSSEQVNRLVELTKAKRWENLTQGEYRLIVDDAGDAAADIGEWASSSGLTLEAVEPYLPPFDDVFVELVSRLTPEKEDERV